jgi:hypothetical protein
MCICLTRIMPRGRRRRLGTLNASAADRRWHRTAVLAVDPVRAADITFAAPYLEIDGVYLVPAV